MNIRKYYWAIRAMLYKSTFKHIGKYTYFGKPMYIDGKNRISIGNKVRIFPGIRMEAIGNGTINIGNNVVIEQNAHIISGGGILTIPDDVTIGPNCFITNVNHEYRNISKSVIDQELIVSETTIGEGCFLGFGVAIQAGTHLGKHCIIGSNSVVKGNFPDYCVIVGSPGKVIKHYDIVKGIWE